MSIFRRLLNRIVRFFKPSAATISDLPTLYGAYHKLEKMTADFDDISFYVAQLQGFKYPDNFHKYVNSASFNLCSIRDELKLALEKEVENGYIDRISRHKTSSN